MSNFFFDKDISRERINDKTERKVLAHGDKLMTCHLYFDAGGVGEPHRHPHTQCTFVISGTYEFTIDGDNTVIKAGDSVFIPSDALHGLVCLEKGEIIDVFTPEREDFLI